MWEKRGEKGRRGERERERREERRENLNRVENSKLLRRDTQTKTQITTPTAQNLPETWVGVGWQSNMTSSKDHNSLTIDLKYIEVSERPEEVQKFPGENDED